MIDVSHGRRLKQDFLSRLDCAHNLESLFDYIPNVYFFVKNRERRFVSSNRAFARLLGFGDEEELLGRPEPDFVPPDLCERYAADDTAVLESAIPVVERVELVTTADGSIAWHNTTKLPLFDNHGSVIGVAGVMREVGKMHANNARLLSMAPALETIMRDYAEPLSIARLAEQVSLSRSQFNRQFKKKFQTTPLKYLTKVRIDAACRLLAETELPISDIALQTGFYDQSHFTHQFMPHKHMTPSQYRKKCSQPIEVPGRPAR